MGLFTKNNEEFDKVLLRSKSFGNSIFSSPTELRVWKKFYKKLSPNVVQVWAA